MQTDSDFEIWGPKGRPTLDQLAHKETVPELWTDKRSSNEFSKSQGFVCHDYLRIYDREWSKWRDQEIRLLEIGLNVGASIKLWLEYFTKAKIVGLDIDLDRVRVDRLPNIGRFEAIKGSAFDPYFLQQFVESQNNFEIIIDDGAHFSGPIIMAFQYLWAKVNPGGYYVIEDLTEVNNPESHSAGFPNQIQFAESLLGRIIMGGRSDVDEAFVSKDLVILKKK